MAKNDAQNSQGTPDAAEQSKKDWAVYVAQRQIKHNGKRYAEGKELRLSDEHAEPLLAIGAVEKRKETK